MISVEDRKDGGVAAGQSADTGGTAGSVQISGDGQECVGMECRAKRNADGVCGDDV